MSERRAVNVTEYRTPSTLTRRMHLEARCFEHDILFGCRCVRALDASFVFWGPERRAMTPVASDPL